MAASSSRQRHRIGEINYGEAAAAVAQQQRVAAA